MTDNKFFGKQGVCKTLDRTKERNNFISCPLMGDKLSFARWTCLMELDSKEEKLDKLLQKGDEVPDSIIHNCNQYRRH